MASQAGRTLRWAALGLVPMVVVIACVGTRGGDGGNIPSSPSAAQAGEHSYSGPPHAPFISITRFKPIYDRGDPDYVLVDVRPAELRAEAHIPGDVWVPLSDASSTGWKALLPYRKGIIVLYCGCPFAEAATMSVVLMAHGFSDRHLRVLREGLPGWQAAGFPVDSDPEPCEAHLWPKACANL